MNCASHSPALKCPLYPTKYLTGRLREFLRVRYVRRVDALETGTNLDGGIASMTEQKALSEALALALLHIRALHGTLAATLIDVAALRQIVLNSPKESKRYRKVLTSEAAKVRPLVATAMQAYDEEILHIKTISQWRN